jgi:hypothetical protein
VARPSLDQRAIDREVLGRPQRTHPGLLQHPGEEGLRDVPLQQPLSVLGEDGGVPDRGIHRQPHEPVEEQIVIELLDQCPLTPDRVEDLQQQGPEQLLGRNRGTTRLGIAPSEPRRQLREHGIHHDPDRAQGMVLRHPLLGQDVAEHRLGDPIVAAHAPLLVTAESGMAHRSIRRFPAPC